MSWLDRLERKLGKYCIKNLMLYIVVSNLIVFLLSYIGQGYAPFITKLALIPSLVMQGEIWRLATFLFIPMDSSPIWTLFTLYFYYMIGSTLEHEWGSFKFNMYYLIGVLGTIGSAFIVGYGSAVYLNLSLIFAFSYLFPDFQILLFFFIPVKIKYLSILYLLFLVYTFISNPLIGLIIVGGSALNFVVFFGKDIILRLATGRKAYYNRKSFEGQIPRKVAIHRCHICGRTEKDDKNLEFRYCIDCEGDYEYCMDHLYTHEHVKNVHGMDKSGDTNKTNAGTSGNTYNIGNTNEDNNK